MTTLPQLPTDNLYKFVFLSGLTLIFSAFILFFTQYDGISSKLDEANIEITKLEKETEFLKEDIDSLNKQLNTIKIHTVQKESDTTVDYFKDFQRLGKKLQQKDFREYMKFIYDYKADIVPYYHDLKSLNEKSIEHKKKNRELVVTYEIISIKAKQLRASFNELIVLCFIVFGLIIIGYLLAKAGVTKWYNLVQKPLDEKLQLELQHLKSKKIEGGE